MKTPIQFKADIVQRFLKGKEYADFRKSYNEARFSEGRARYEPTKAHIVLFDKFLRKQISLQDAAKEMDITDPAARSRFAVIAFARLSE
jgi:hypothetical protein